MNQEKVNPSHKQTLAYLIIEYEHYDTIYNWSCKKKKMHNG